MRVTLLGTGCPQVDPNRMAPTVLVEAGGLKFLIDCGSGVTQRLVEAGTRGSEIDLVLISHIHTDHLVDFYQLLVSGWHQGRVEPLRMLGPPALGPHVRTIMDAWKEERDLRIAYEQRASATGLEVEIGVLDPGIVFEGNGVRVIAGEVDHRPVTPAYGFRFEYEGRRVAISCDTRPCPGLADLARGADLLVNDCFIHAGMAPNAHRGQASIDAVEAYHTQDREVGRVAAEAGVEVLMLTHFVPTVFDKPKLVETIRASYGGLIFVGEDLMAVDLARRTVTHKGAVIGY